MTTICLQPQFETTLADYCTGNQPTQASTTKTLQGLTVLCGRRRRRNVSFLFDQHCRQPWIPFFDFFTLHVTRVPCCTVQTSARNLSPSLPLKKRSFLFFISPTVQNLGKGISRREAQAGRHKMSNKWVCSSTRATQPAGTNLVFGGAKTTSGAAEDVVVVAPHPEPLLANSRLIRCFVRYSCARNYRSCAKKCLEHRGKVMCVLPPVCLVFIFKKCFGHSPLPSSLTFFLLSLSWPLLLLLLLLVFSPEQIEKKAKQNNVTLQQNSCSFR